MANLTQIYPLVWNSLWDKMFDGDADVFKAMMLTSAYTPDRSAHQFKDDLTNEVAASGGYPSGGWTLTNFRFWVEQVGSVWNGGITFDPLDISGTTALGRYLVIYDSTPALDADKPLVAVTTFRDDNDVPVDKAPQSVTPLKKTGSFTDTGLWVVEIGV